jgi:CDP-diglyceride synthetase
MSVIKLIWGFIVMCLIAVILFCGVIAIVGMVLDSANGYLDHAELLKRLYSAAISVGAFIGLIAFFHKKDES